MEQQQHHQSGVKMRLMQVKVLYTFNDESKSNCLARCPQAQDIQTAQLDSSNELGIIELKTCIQAIAAASPELVARLGQDYTVYAYDYSEYETPLVGQGMLSWILASASSTPMAPAHQSRTMVTGKICKNILGLFSDGAKETLEVKLRLVPVPTCLQSEYLASMEKYRNAGLLHSEAIEGSPEAAAWASLFETNNTFGQTPLPLPAPPNSHPCPQHEPNTPCTYRPAPPVGQNTDNSSFNPMHNTLFLDGNAALYFDPPQSRPTTPLQQQMQPQPGKRITTSRPSSRNSTRGRPSIKQSQSCSSRVELNQNHADTSEAEDGPKRKRARITKTDWNGGSTFGANGESLRVTAAAAASIRSRRPFGGAFLTSDVANGELGDRPPTPRPRQATAQRPVPSFPRSLTSTTDELTIHAEPVARRAYTNDPLGILAESSPEKNDQSSAGSTPMDLPSSPPVPRNASPGPSSPSLPNLRFHDSGFDSGNFDELMSEYDKFDAAQDMDSMGLSNDIPPRFGPSDKAPPVDPNTLGRKLIPGPRPPPFQASEIVPAPSPPSVSSRKLAPKSRTQSMSKATSGKMTITDSAPEDQSLDVQSLEARVALLSSAVHVDDGRFRSESCLTDFGSQCDSPPVEDHQSRRARTVTHEKKKQAIQTRLSESIKAGQMPRFCKNCGEIKTPSWRKAFIKVESGDHRVIKVSEDEGGIQSCEPIDTDEDGNIIRYRIVKKKITTEDTGFEEIELCNPCGIWLFKNKIMRPQVAWDKQSDSKPRRKSSSKKKSGEEGDESLGAVQENFESRPAGEEASSNTATGQDCNRREVPTQLRTTSRHQRANSLGPLCRPTLDSKYRKGKSAEAALQRAIQSSPPRFPGSQVSPIEIDLDQELSPKPTNRLLFPSPRRSGEMKSLNPSMDKQTSPLGRKGKHVGGPAIDVFENKENEPPATDNDQDNGSGDLLEDNNGKLVTTPKCKTSSSSNLQTPSRSSKRTPLSSRDFMSSGRRRRRHSNPTTPSRAFGGASLLAGQQMTPFTAQLTQLLSESNEADGTSLDSYAIDDMGIFSFSDFSSGDANSHLAFFDQRSHSAGDFWTENDPFNDSIEEYLNSNDSPRQLANVIGTGSRPSTAD